MLVRDLPRHLVWLFRSRREHTRDQRIADAAFRLCSESPHRGTMRGLDERLAIERSLWERAYAVGLTR